MRDGGSAVSPKQALPLTTSQRAGGLDHQRGGVGGGSPKARRAWGTSSESGQLGCEGQGAGDLRVSPLRGPFLAQGLGVWGLAGRILWWGPCPHRCWGAVSSRGRPAG